MRGFRRGRLAAVAGFALVAAVVLGGMTWATVSAWQLAKMNVEREYRERRSKAVWRMDTYLSAILGEQMGHPYTDYMPYYTDEPVQVWLGTSEVEADRVVLRSPIVSSSERHNWIRLHFQVDEDGYWSSPQYPCHCKAFTMVRPSQQACSCSHPSLEWLSRALPLAELGEKMARARLRDAAAPPAWSLTKTPGSDLRQEVADGEASSALPSRTEYSRRMLRKREAQLRSRPPAQCLIPEGETENIADIVSGERDVPETEDLASVGVHGDTWASFWIESPNDSAPSLAFVRSGHRDAQLVYQGFVADWKLLKGDLLGEIGHIIENADLEPGRDDAPPEPALSDVTMNTIPARLTSPELADATITAQAWGEVGGVLVTTWSAATAVLMVAGIGFRNLISLTERRMQFAYAVTHELRTPLTTFRLYSDMLSAGLVPEGSKQEYLDTLNREALRLSSLVEGVLEYARLENHKVALNTVEVDAASLLAVIAEDLEKRCRECRVEPRTYNGIANGLVLHTDVDVVNRVAGVLINNACRHTQGVRNPLVMVRLEQVNGAAQLEVIDSGPGIEHRDARTIFKPFRRGRNADSTAQGGIGLGLALARSWASLLGGQLELIARHHRELGGAHFRLTIPIRN